VQHRACEGSIEYAHDIMVARSIEYAHDIMVAESKRIAIHYCTSRAINLISFE
jgi:hypothetical protein